MPLLAELGVKFIMPFTGDYIGAMAYMFALALSLIIVVYVMSFGKVLMDQYQMPLEWMILLLTSLILFHFLPFNVGETNNGHMFLGRNVTCTFNYIIPGLLNAIMVMYLMKHPMIKWSDKRRGLYHGGVLLMIYLCINSNMFYNIILISFIGMRLLYAFIVEITRSSYKKYRGIFIRNYFKRNGFELFVVEIWLISLIMESSAMNAKQSGSVGLRLPIKDTIYLFYAINMWNEQIVFGVCICDYNNCGYCM